MDIETANTIRVLEESLWRIETRHNLLLMRQTFADEVVEFGQSGRIYTLEDLLPEQANAGFTATLPLPAFKASYLSRTVVQTTYVSELFTNGKVEHVNRSSIWIKHNTAWCLRFHQGTPVEK
ncbi:hypothetical protein OAI26_00755 [Sulfitobacter sp.]|nr:hypothetical protein [Sulfitobacter sp.]